MSGDVVLALGPDERRKFGCRRILEAFDEDVPQISQFDLVGDFEKIPLIPIMLLTNAVPDQTPEASL